MGLHKLLINYDILQESNENPALSAYPPICICNKGQNLHLPTMEPGTNQNKDKTFCSRRQPESILLSLFLERQSESIVLQVT